MKEKQKQLPSYTVIDHLLVFFSILAQKHTYKIHSPKTKCTESKLIECFGKKKKLIACQKQQFFSRFVFGSFDHKTNKKSTYILWPKTIEKKNQKKRRKIETNPKQKNGSTFFYC